MTTLPPLLTSDALAAYLAAPEDLRADAVTDWVRGRCGWHIAPTITETVTLDGNGGRTITLDTLHLTDVTGVMVSGAPMEVEWSELGMLRHPTRWPDQWRAVTVTITHGYQSVPADLAKVVAEAISRLPAPGTPGREKIGPFEYVNDALFMPDELATIDRYRLLPTP